VWFINIILIFKIKKTTCIYHIKFVLIFIKRTEIKKKLGFFYSQKGIYGDVESVTFKSRWNMCQLTICF